MNNIKSQVFNILEQADKPARYTGGELNQTQKDLSDKSIIRIAMCFPDIYEIGMSNLGLRILYDVLNKEQDTFCERAFAPASDMYKLMKDRNIPLYTLETFSKLADFDMIGFSLAYELCYTTVLDMLEQGGIPVFSKDRTDHDPIVIAGGHACVNPSVMSPFIDAFIIGDGEEVILEIKNILSAHRRNRKDILKSISKLKGVYVPSIHSKTDIIETNIVRNFNEASFPETLIIPNIRIIHERIILEIMRGCSRGCRFCQAGAILRPIRERDPNKLLAQAEKLVKNTGYEEIALTSLSSTDYSQIEPLITKLTEAFESDRIGISLPSIRADVNCVKLADSIQKVRKSGLTFAPEAGSQRLRDIINKNLTEEDIMDAVTSAIECGWKRIKFYFMIGLPYETDEDILAICQLVLKARSLAKEKKANLTISITVSPFVPKPHTVFQWRAMNSKDELERKINILKRNMPKSILMSWHEPIASVIEAVLARGDERLANVIYEVFTKGNRLEQDNFNSNIWESALEKFGLSKEIYANKDYEYTDILPWDNIYVGVEKDFLISEDKKAQESLTTTDCRKICSNCGARLNKKCMELAQSKINYQIQLEKPVTTDRFGTAIFKFSKDETLRFIGHLDLMGIFERAVRISRIPVWYSKGFNPKPRISLSWALTLGATADNDVLAIRVYLPTDPTELLNKLNTALPSGIKLKNIEIVDSEVKIDQPTASIYKLILSDNYTKEEITQVCNNILSKSEIIVQRKKARNIKALNIRPLIDELRIADTDSAVIVKLPHKTNTAKPIEIFDLIKNELPNVELLLINRNQLIF